MEFHPFTIHYQRRLRKRQADQFMLRAPADGLTSVVEDQRCFANEFSLFSGRVFSGRLESFKGKESREVISTWLSGDEEGASILEILFEDLVKHQLAMLEAAGEICSHYGDIPIGEDFGRWRAIKALPNNYVSRRFGKSSHVKVNGDILGFDE